MVFKVQNYIELTLVEKIIKYLERLETDNTLDTVYQFNIC